MLKFSHNLGWMQAFSRLPAKWGLDFDATLKIMKTLGLDALEFYPSLFAYSNNTKRIKELVHENGLYFYSAHLPMVAGVLLNENLWEYQREWVHSFGELGAKVIVVHAEDIKLSEQEMNDKFPVLLRYLEYLSDVAEKSGMKIALENLWSKEPLYKLEQIERVKKHLTNDNIGFCLDTGHAFGTMDEKAHDNPMQNLMNVFDIMKDRLFNIHLHDTDKNSDKHLPLGKGSIDWDLFFSAVRGLSPNFPLTIEIDPRCPIDDNENIKQLLEELYRPFFAFA